MTCEIYLLNVSSLTVSEEHLNRLSAERQKKVMACKHKGARRLSLGAGLLLDYALRQHGLCEKNVEYSYGAHGKPSLSPSSLPTLGRAGGEARRGIYFNLSHSGDMVACAIAPYPVGVDIECTSRRVGDALIQRVCNRAEIELVHNDPLAFFDLWTAKEAVVKMTGEGISGDITAIDTSRVKTWRTPEGYALSVICGGDSALLGSHDFYLHECSLGQILHGNGAAGGERL